MKNKKPKVLRISNTHNVLSKGWAYVSLVSLQDAFTKARPVIFYISPKPYEKFPTTALLLEKPSDIKAAYISKEWLEHENSYNGFKRGSTSGYYLAKVRAKSDEFKMLSAYPSWVKNAVAYHKRKAKAKQVKKGGC